MRYRKYITEARRNPKLNPKLGIVQQLEKYKDREDIYISFTGVDKNEKQPKKGEKHLFPKGTNKIGINPKTKFDTPAGVYAYPLKAMWNNIKGDTIPFASDREYIQVLQVNHPNLIDVVDYTNDMLKTDINKLKHLFIEKAHINLEKHHNDTIANIHKHIKVTAEKIKEDEVKKDVISRLKARLEDEEKVKNDNQNYYTSEEGQKDIEDIINRAAAGAYNNPKAYTASKFFNIMKELSSTLAQVTNNKKQTWEWNWLLRKLGYEGFSDKQGTGVIHRNEPIQAFFTSMKHVKHLDSILNKRYENDDEIIIDDDNIDTVDADMLGNTLDKNNSEYYKVKFPNLNSFQLMRLLFRTDTQYPYDKPTCFRLVSKKFKKQIESNPDLFYVLDKYFDKMDQRDQIEMKLYIQLNKPDSFPKNVIEMIEKKLNHKFEKIYTYKEPVSGNIIEGNKEFMIKQIQIDLKTYNYQLNMIRERLKKETNKRYFVREVELMKMIKNYNFELQKFVK